MGIAATLIVPMDVQALTVGALDAQNQVFGHLPMADFTQLQAGMPYVGQAVNSNALPLQGEAQFLQGIHLHWALPDALTQGIGTDTITFPTVPNRWLVTRILQDTTNAEDIVTLTLSWVVESDRLMNGTSCQVEGMAQLTVPLQPGGPQLYQYLGGSFPLSQWAAAEAADARLAPLTVIGYGEHTFASYYPNCANVFGFVDTFADNPQCNMDNSLITYQVTGWYANPTDDPLNPQTTNSVTAAALAAAWAFTGSPTATVLSGFVGGIPYIPGQGYLASALPDTSSFTAAIAPSQAEAVSALMASQPAASQLTNAEQTLNALQFGLLTAQGQMDALAQFEMDVHAAGFGSMQAGTEWSIVAQTASQTGSQTTALLPEETTLPVTLAALLDTLNGAQFVYDSANRGVVAAQWQIFEDWFKLQTVAYVGTPNYSFSTSSLQAYAQQELNGLAAMQALLPGLSTALQNAYNAVAAALPSGFNLVSSTSPQNYSVPHDPVLIVAGSGIAACRRYGYDGAQSPGGLLPCRLDSDLVTGLSLGAGVVSGSTPVTLGGTNLPQLVETSALPAMAQTLMQEPFYLESTLMPSLVSAIATADPGPDNPSTLNAATLTTNLTPAQSAFLANAAPLPLISFSGTAPDASGMVDGSQVPWLPLRLEYSLQYTPVSPLIPGESSAYTAGVIQSNFALTEGDPDFTYTGPALYSASVQTVSGSVLLTGQVSNDLTAAIAAYVANTPNAGLSALLQAVAGVPLLAQAMDGFTPTMQMREPDLQVPIADPGGVIESAIVQSIAAAVGPMGPYSPMPDAAFNPVRAGQLVVASLRVVDVFGRYVTWTPATVVSQSMQPPTGWAANSAFLAPRLTQPARLLCDWVSAENMEIETNTHPATSPVIGFVVPNYLDNSLLIYNSAGTLLLVVSGGSTMQLTPAPGSGFASTATLAEIFAAEPTADLLNFATALGNNGASAFASFFDTVESALQNSLPSAFLQSTSLASLCGQPLALARMSLTLDLATAPALDASWYSFNNAVNHATPPPCLWDAAAFPLLLGDSAQLNDTLVGFYLESNSGTDFSTFYNPYGATGQGVAAQTSGTLALVPEGGATVLMLLDPRGSVHVTSGILPVQSVQIPPDQWASALSGMAVSFTARPLLSGATAGPPSLTLPSTGNTQSWSWATQASGQWTSTPVPSQATPTATLSYSPQTVQNGWLVLTVSG